MNISYPWLFANPIFAAVDHEITMYTDGAAKGNPGPGGYGVILMFNGHKKELSGGYRRTTNNRMELLAVIEGLKALKKKELPIVIYSDSKYVVDAIDKKWVNRWVKTEFKGGKKNRDLWLQFYKLSQELNVRMVWVRGHANNPFNNRCDQLATSAADGKDLLTDKGFENEHPV